MTPGKITVYNSLTRQKEELKPLTPGTVRMYACGITPYDSNHIGHAMQAIFFDVIRSFLECQGYEVIYVRNYTDVDDKIIARAAELGMPPRELSEKIIAENQHEMATLSVRPATHEPKVTETIPEIIAMITDLVDRGWAYATDCGDVYYRVQKKSDYGKLSGRKTDELRAGTREIKDGAKEDELDFALWKSDTTPDASWPSPWGQGRPGWHIECSAMAKKFLGEQFDIHGGGRDLIFPHHENEIAQSEAANDGPYSSVWLHSGLLTVDKQKMSKSIGNSITIKDFLADWPAEVLRLAFVSNQYSSNIDFSQPYFQACLKRLVYAYDTLLRLNEALADQTTESNGPGTPWPEFCSAMADNFNSPRGIGCLNTALRQVNQILSKKLTPANLETLASHRLGIQKIGQCLGILRNDPASFLDELKTSYLQRINLEAASLERLIQDRANARSNKDWAASDTIRDHLAEQGIVLRDTSRGTDWTVSDSV